MKKTVLLIIILAFVGLSISLFFKGKTQTSTAAFQEKGGERFLNTLMKISSPVFNNNEYIPDKYTCSDADVNPELVFEDVPEDAQSLVLIVDDPDAPGGRWTHWIVWNIDPKLKVLAENSVPQNSLQGKNDFGDNKYGGPCPPPGNPHRYRFKLYALNTILDLDDNTTQFELKKDIKNHILAKAELVGLYKR